ncbi:MAG: RidA family protein [Gammaproteobacteria bacterium]
MNPSVLTRTRRIALLATVFFVYAMPVLSNAQDGEPVAREYLTLDWTEGRAFSPAVTTQGGKTVWLAGVTAPQDADGNSLAGDFEAQTHEIFRVIEERLATFGGTLADIVTMTVYIGDTRYGDPFIDIRATKFEPGNYPSSALITVVGFARPGILLEVKATAVVSAD